MAPKIHSTSAENPPLGEHLWGTGSACQKNLNYGKFLFIVVARNSLTPKMDK